jgi:hypothetical protein
MQAYQSQYPGKLIFPNGQEIDKGGEITLTAEQAANLGVKYFIDAGWIVGIPGTEVDESELVPAPEPELVPPETVAEKPKK